MKTTTRSANIRLAIAAAAVCALTLAPLAATAQDGNGQKTENTKEGVTTQQIVHVSATVTAVDPKTRTVTLKGPDGHVSDYHVSEEVKRFSEIKVGDRLDVGYLESVGLEFRQATPEEMKEPLKVTESSDRADQAQAPAGAKLRTTRAVVTLEGISRMDHTLTVRTPRGNYFQVEVQPDAVKWEELKIGQTMVGTYTEALVMSIAPAKKE